MGGLLQTSMDFKLGHKAGQRDLVLMHIPFNFGHTVEAVAMLGTGQPGWDEYMESVGAAALVGRRASWEEVRLRAMWHPGAEIWGHANPDLQVLSEVTGCPMFYTPPKHWPVELAQKYFGNKTVFGLLRDPYERLVAFFRGNIPGYGPTHSEYVPTCDVNMAVKKTLQDYLAGRMDDPSCSLLPQAEHFEGQYGIKLPVNLREFPRSMNQVLREHGYPEDFQIHAGDVRHVTDCPNVWAADLDAETRGLVQQIYAKDFELLCKHFGYCNREENCCLYQVEQMCPQRVLDLGYRGHEMPGM